MPSPEHFTEEVRRLGVNQSSTVIVYDQRGLYSAPRAWWMFKVMGHEKVAVLDGGLEAWKSAGLPTRTDRKAPLEMMRQVQIAAGGLVLIGVGLGLLVHPGFFGLAAFVGAGLTFAGATGFCGMARLLALAPWNRPARS